MFNDDVRDAVNFLLNPPAVHVYNGAIATANITTTYGTFASERYDTDAMHSTSSLTNRLTCTLAGLYWFHAEAEFAGSAGGSQRSVLVRLNGAGTPIRQHDGQRNGAAATRISLPGFEYKLALGDFVEFGWYHDAGASLNVTPLAFGMTWRGVG